jgi:hypothetical protein
MTDIATNIDLDPAYTTAELNLTEPDSKTFSLSVIDDDDADDKINVTAHSRNASAGVNAGSHAIISIYPTSDEVRIFKHTLNGETQVQLYAAKLDLRKAYLCPLFDYENDTQLKLVAVDDSGIATDEISGTTAKVSGTVAIDDTAAARDVIIISNDSTGRELIAETTSEADGTFNVQWSGWTGSVIALAIDAYGSDWTANKTVSAGDITHPSTANGYVYKCTITGTTGDDEPVWSTDGTTSVIDGSVTWAPQPFYRPVGSGPIQPEITYPEGIDAFVNVISGYSPLIWVKLNDTSEPIVDYGSLSLSTEDTNINGEPTFGQSPLGDGMEVSTYLDSSTGLLLIDSSSPSEELTEIGATDEAHTVIVFFSCTGDKTESESTWYSGRVIAELRHQASRGNVPFSIGVDNDGGYLSAGYSDIDDGGTTGKILSEVACNDGEPHMAVVVINNKTYSLYLDNLGLQGQASLTVGSNLGTGDTVNLTVGMRTLNNGNAGAYFDGFVQNFIIIPAALTAEEIETVYASAMNAATVEETPFLIQYDGTSLDGWTNNGATIDGTEGDSAPSFYLSPGQYAWANLDMPEGVTGLIGYTISFSAKVTSGGLMDFFFACDETGLGNNLRIEGRNNKDSGIGVANSWTSWGVPSGMGAIADGAWHTYQIVVGDGTVDVYMDGSIALEGVAITNNGNCIGLIGDGGSYAGWFDNITIEETASA